MGLTMNIKMQVSIEIVFDQYISMVRLHHSITFYKTNYVYSILTNYEARVCQLSFNKLKMKTPVIGSFLLTREHVKLSAVLYHVSIKVDANSFSIRIRKKTRK